VVIPIFTLSLARPGAQGLLTWGIQIRSCAWWIAQRVPQCHNATRVCADNPALPLIASGL
jgi:hypothetical protein